MDRTSLEAAVDREGIDPGAVTFDPERADEQYVLRTGAGGWIVYYAERGHRRGERRFDTETEACTYLFEVLVNDPTTRRTR